eukprot:gnl/MRDRNA2_/MRDRNA2_88260_c0_seq1.p1 gnl/MRDRNA2_/MRDRNA2_88260_c0~~gnl/MRDRNA2_/MRDRNA2_88260_c0_seq1.p1  ORF type:complete len:230 (+),score=87.75 gnl/MRDRNA2_/MRDRNA2_88260_c0_seq1:115-804(+)
MAEETKPMDVEDETKKDQVPQEKDAEMKDEKTEAEGKAEEEATKKAEEEKKKKEAAEKLKKLKEEEELKKKMAVKYAYEVITNDLAAPVAVRLQQIVKGSPDDQMEVEVYAEQELTPGSSMAPTRLRANMKHQVCVKHMVDQSWSEYYEKCQEVWTPFRAEESVSYPVSGIIAEGKPALIASEPQSDFADHFIPGAFALASLMLVLVGLKKSCSLQKPVQRLRTPLMDW